MKIDVSTDFTLDTPHYWDRFWIDRDGIGVGGADPDSFSKNLQRYHQIIWSKRLPCGDTMELQRGSGANYLTWNGFRFGSDSIIVSFRYKRYLYMLEEVKKAVPDYKAFVEDYIHKSYTIGGTMIFPKHAGSINQAKGTNAQLCDRWDLTMECIRRYYLGESSPIYNTLLGDKDFFDLFVDFQGFVDFFYLQDCVTDDYRDIHFWIDNREFDRNPLPQSVDEYLLWIDQQMIFLDKRNRRIANAFSSRKNEK